MRKKSSFARSVYKLCLAGSILLFTSQLSAQFSSNKPIPSRTEAQVSQQKVSSVSDYLKNEKTSEVIVTASHVSRVSGIAHTYLRQSINGLEIYGTESSVHRAANGEIVQINDNFISDINSQMRSSAAGIDAGSAVQSVAQQMGYTIDNLVELERSQNPNRKAVFSKAGISVSEIPAKLMYYYREGIGIHLVWELSVEEIDSSDWWNFRVDATTGMIIDKDNFTVYCFGDSHDHDDHLDGCDEWNISQEETLFYTVAEQPTMAVGSYNVIAYPDESPNHGALGRQVVVDPDNATASPFGWHDTDGVAGAESEYTIGNNVDAYDDRTSTVTGTGSGVDSERAFGGPTLTFSDSWNPNINLGTDQSIDAAVTNLFYWSNIIHDITYQYGFDEAGGNFQVNNYGNGGVAGDSVRGEAQDGSGTCNANFSTPADGGRGRMQMYVCGTRDGDFDNGVIIHEYGHGISNRLTGGAGAAGCLGNQEQMGEGWSDYYGLMLTMESGDAGTDSRGIGTWLVGQAGNGPGIRTYPYSIFSTGINPHTYDDIKTEAVPHGVGSVWCAMLWEMTWELIDDHGFSTDLYTFTGDVNTDAGNVQALALVTEGMKLQGCSPGFIDGRDAILQADQNIYGGANQCAIWEAFARRGLGYSADQGASTSRADGTEAFDVPPITLAVTEDSFCLGEGPITIGGGVISGGSYSGPGVTDDSNGSTFTFDPATAGVGTHTITYTAVDCNGITNSATDTVTVTNTAPVASCQAITLNLDASGTAILDPLAATSATLTSGNNSSGSEGFTVLQVNITENVNISFDWTYSTSDGPQYDSFGYVLGSTYTAISDETAGSGNNQSGTFNLALTAGDSFGLAMRTTDNQFGAATGTVTNFTPGFTGQFSTPNWTEVLQQSDGTTSFSGAMTSVTSSCGTTVATPSQTVFTCLDIGTQSVDVTVTDDSGLNTVCSAIVTVVGTGNATQFVGGAWSAGAPTGVSAVTISDDYDTATLGSFDACSCEVDATRTLTIGAGDYMQVAGDITVNGTLIVEHEGSVVQIDDAAVTTNNGTINVLQTTPNLASRDFMILGSPMSGETRTSVWNSAFLVLDATTANFVPNPDVAAAFPGAENFVDDNNDFWGVYSGTLDPGEGYLVRPQSGFGQ
ncbi:MAG: M36 family metallopeptidase, partial [Bacteroidota bacterium]